MIVALVACYALAARVQFEVAFAYAVPTQLVLVPMLFLAPLNLVPVLVALGCILSTVPEHLRGELHVGRAGLHFVSAWHSVGPVLVLAAFGSPSPTLGNLPVIALALAAQFTLDFASSAARGFAALGIGPRELARALGPAWLVDVALTPLGIALAYASLTQSYAFLLGLPLMGLLAYFARERASRIDHALELSHAYRGTALPARRRGRGRRRVHGPAQPGCRLARPQRGRPARARLEGDGERPSSRRSSTTSAR